MANKEGEFLYPHIPASVGPSGNTGGGFQRVSFCGGKRLDGIIIICILTVVLKVWYIPSLLKNVSSRVSYKVEKDFFINIPISIIISCGLVILTWYMVSEITGIKDIYERKFLVNSMSVILIGLFFMISRKKPSDR